MFPVKKKVLVALSILSVIGMGAALGAAPAPSTAAGANPAAPVGAPLVDPQQLVEHLGTTVYKDVFGGFTAPNNGAEIDVFLTKLDPAIEAAFDALSPLTRVVFKATPNTVASLTAWTQTLESKWDAIESAGTQLIGFGPDVDTGKLKIEVADPTASDEALFNDMFGSANVEIQAVSPEKIAGEQLDLDRLHDTAPYYGGDAIMDSNQSVGGCTSGWGVSIGGAHRLLTAGHCYAVGTAIVNLKVTNTGPSGSGAAMGSVTQRGLGDDLDSEVFTGCNGAGTCGGTGSIWTGDVGSTTTTPVGGGGTWAEGDTVCVAGPYGGQECDLTVTSDDNYCHTLESQHFCHLTRTTGSNLPNAGDSGAPTFRMNNGYAMAVGTHTGHYDATGEEWFTGIYAELNEWNATLLTVE